MKQTSSKKARNKRAIVSKVHHVLVFSLIAILFSALVLGEIFKVYDIVWWWDDMLHGISGLIGGLVGLLAIYLFNARQTAPLKPLFVAVFVFCFAMTTSVLWELYEFIMDYFFKFTMQQWNMGPNAIVMGKSYQGMGLRDTMSDLSMACIGAILAAVFAFFAYAHERLVVLGVMRRFFPWMKRSK